MRESIELDPGRENNKVAVMAKLGHLEVERQTIKDQLHLAKEELTSPNLSKLEKLRKEKEIQSLFERGEQIKKEQARVARSFAGGLKEGKELLLEAGIDWFQKK